MLNNILENIAEKQNNVSVQKFESAVSLLLILVSLNDN